MKQNRYSLGSERSAVLKKEVNKLKANDFIRDTIYLNGIKPGFSQKAKWKMKDVIDYSNLHKACPKGSISLSKIDQLVDITARHELLSFMDAYSGYN